jgi:hypothetical protein
MAREKARVLLVSGSRYWGTDRKPIVARELGPWPAGSWIVHGAQRRRIPDAVEYLGAEQLYTGVDWLADGIARERGFFRVQVPYVDALGKSGGPARNRVMAEIVLALWELRHPVEAILFHDQIEESRGTKNMRGNLERLGIPYRLVEE